jgi:hypothetical protein
VDHRRRATADDDLGRVVPRGARVAERREIERQQADVDVPCFLSPDREIGITSTASTARERAGDVPEEQQCDAELHRA